MSTCQPEAVQVRDLHCGDQVYVNGYFGVDHWTADSPAFPSYPVPGKFMVSKMAQGTLAVFGHDTDIVLRCGTGPCASSLCAYCNPRS